MFFFLKTHPLTFVFVLTPAPISLFALTILIKVNMSHVESFSWLYMDLECSDLFHTSHFRLNKGGGGSLVRDLWIQILVGSITEETHGSLYLNAMLASDTVYLNDVVFCVRLPITHVSSWPSVHLRNSEVTNLIELILSWTLWWVCTVWPENTPVPSRLYGNYRDLRGVFVYRKHG